MEHKITVDEEHEDGAPLFRAYCTDECGWAAPYWEHADTQPSFDPFDPDTLGRATAEAFNAADAAGQVHLDDVGAR